MKHNNLLHLQFFAEADPTPAPAPAPAPDTMATLAEKLREAQEAIKERDETISILLNGGTPAKNNGKTASAEFQKLLRL